jgi:hypothetical protein
LFPARNILALKRQKTISEFLSNAKTFNQKASFQCAGPPWCHEDSHFSADLKDMPSFYGTVGRLNAKDVPFWDNKNNIPHLYEQWLKKLILYKSNISLAEKYTTKSILDNAHLPLLLNNAISRCIAKDRLDILYLNYTKNCQHLGRTVTHVDFFTDLQQCTQRQDTTNRQFIIPPGFLARKGFQNKDRKKCKPV